MYGCHLRQPAFFFSDVAANAVGRREQGEPR